MDSVELVAAAAMVPRLIEEKLKPAFAPVGNPLTVRLTMLLNPPIGVSVTAKLVPVPADTVLEVAVGVTENPRYRRFFIHSIVASISVVVLYRPDAKSAAATTSYTDGFQSAGNSHCACI